MCLHELFAQSNVHRILLMPHMPISSTAMGVMALATE